MKTLGKIFLGLIILVAIGLGYTFVQSGRVNKETKAYLDAELPQIITNWDVEELWKRASPEFMSSVKKEEIADMFSKFSKHLGKFVSYDGVMGGAGFNINFTSSGRMETATCLTKAEYANGTAEIKVSLIKHGGVWQIAGIFVNSKALMD